MTHTNTHTHTLKTGTCKIYDNVATFSKRGTDEKPSNILGHSRKCTKIKILLLKVLLLHKNMMILSFGVTYPNYFSIHYICKFYVIRRLRHLLGLLVLYRECYKKFNKCRHQISLRYSIS